MKTQKTQYGTYLIGNKYSLIDGSYSIRIDQYISDSTGEIETERTFISNEHDQSNVYMGPRNFEKCHLCTINCAHSEERHARNVNR